MNPPPKVNSGLTTPTIIWAAFGDIVHAPSMTEQCEPHFVLHRCDTASAPSFYCETHQQRLANLGNLAIHIESGGEHVVAVWCRRHLTYESVGDEDLALIRRAMPT